jgi:hypothetical protein
MLLICKFLFDFGIVKFEWLAETVVVIKEE